MRDNSAHHDPRRYEVRHRTTYSYDGEVEACYERGPLAPRDTPHQTVLAHEVTVTPDPDLVSTHVDHFGNNSYYVEVRTPHDELVVSKRSVVEVAWGPVDVDALDAFTVATAADAAATQAWERVEDTAYRLPSRLVDVAPAVREYADKILPAERPLGEALVDLVTTIHEDFAYKKGATSVKTTLPELLEVRAGVCQDFAHLAIGCLRAVGLTARYVSGYLETAPPPGKPRLQGSDASHAWASVLTPDGRWVDLDPTNDHFADSRYVVTAWGRDYADVSPLKGVVFTQTARSTLSVAVDVIRLD